MCIEDTLARDSRICEGYGDPFSNCRVSFISAGMPIRRTSPSRSSAGTCTKQFRRAARSVLDCFEGRGVQ